jgi:hypothetical protein
MPETPNDVGEAYALQSATLLLLPQWTSRGVDLVPPLSQIEIGRVDAAGALKSKNAAEPELYGPIRVNRLIQYRYHPYGQPRRRVVVPPPPPPMPVVSSVGVMDIGQGSCQMLMNQTPDPIAYFDVGYPLWFFSTSPPADIIYNSPTYAGPILQNQAGNLEVVLSHWDYDHWRLGAIANLQGLRWTYPAQPVGPSATNFINSMVNGNVYPFGTPQMNGPNNAYVIYQCAPAFGASRSVIMNNSGLAMSVETNLPIADPVLHQIYMTGDANFSSMSIAPVFPGATGITAVHHGSNANGALNQVPNPVVPYALVGNIAYSYGMSSTNSHNYGFPVQAAVNQYNALGWNVELSTVEGANLNAAPPTRVNRGNIRMGTQGALNVAYANTAFYLFPHPMT